MIKPSTPSANSFPKPHLFEKNCKYDYEKAVQKRRAFYQNKYPAIENIPYEQFNYSKVFGKCCENVIGYTPIPLGLVGPLLVDGKEFHIPFATAEGTLVASTTRGAKAITLSGGTTSSIYRDGMTRGPCVSFPSVKRSMKLYHWLQDEKNQENLKRVFDSTTNFGHLTSVQSIPVGKVLFLRFSCSTGDAMGMNMVSKGTEKVLETLQKQHFPDMEIVSLSGNVCSDKKPSFINPLEGKGKGVIVECVLPQDIIETHLKTTVDAMVRLNFCKNFVGSAVAGNHFGGFNAHSANIVAAIFLATGQDIAQTVVSSNCMTIFEKGADNGLHVTCTMPSLEVGTVGGGTHLDTQAACLEMLGVKGSSRHVPGDHSKTLATIIASAVMAGELSLMAALSTQTLVKSHLMFNRS